MNLWVARPPRRARRVRRHGRGPEPLPVRADLPAGRARARADRAARTRGRESRAPGRAPGIRRPRRPYRARVCGTPTAAEETLDAPYLAGCDGAHSTVRETLGIGFPGGTYEHLFYVADVEARGPADEPASCTSSLDQAEFIAVFPLKREGHARLVGIVRDEARDARATGSPGTTSSTRPARPHGHRRRARELVLDVPRAPSRRGSVPAGTGLPAGRRRAHPQPRRRAGHEHRHRRRGEPGVEAGGRAQGARRRAPFSTRYEPERIAFARRLVATTDRAFTIVTSRGPLARRVRIGVVPRVVPLLPPLTRCAG